jgi:sphinganine-1-phosphate aldolase
MEAEIINMTCTLFNNKNAYGFITSGGSESIAMGILANKNFYSKKKNIKKPNIVIGESAHPAFLKACHYYNIEVILVTSNKDKTVDISKLRKSIN